MYKNLVLAFIFTLIYSCSEPVEEIEPDSFLNIAGARDYDMHELSNEFRELGYLSKNGR